MVNLKRHFTQMSESAFLRVARHFGDVSVIVWGVPALANGRKRNSKTKLKLLGCSNFCLFFYLVLDFIFLPPVD